MNKKILSFISLFVLLLVVLILPIQDIRVYALVPVPGVPGAYSNAPAGSTPEQIEAFDAAERAANIASGSTGYAETAANPSTANNASGGGGDQVSLTMGNLTRGFGIIGGGVVVIGWIVAGILYLTAAGGPRMEVAKKAIIACVIGTMLIIIATTAEKFIADVFKL